MAGEYTVLALLASVGGLGIPGPGDSALVAAALLAAEGKLSLAPVLVAAFLGCLVGRAVGYGLGAKGGRPLLERPGWFLGFRTGAVAKGDRLFERFPKAAVLLVPAPLSGIHGITPSLFALGSVGVGLSWTLSTGLVSYFLGEQAKDLVGTVGIKGILVIVAFAAIGLGYRYVWRRRRSQIAD